MNTEGLIVMDRTQKANTKQSKGRKALGSGGVGTKEPVDKSMTPTVPGHLAVYQILVPALIGQTSDCKSAIILTSTATSDQNTNPRQKPVKTS